MKKFVDFLSLTSLSILVSSPLFLNGQSQFTIEQANFNRGVTAFRYVVEVANRRLREWKAIDEVIPNVSIEIISKLFQLCAAFENMFAAEKENKREETKMLKLVSDKKSTNFFKKNKKIIIQPE